MARWAQQIVQNSTQFKNIDLIVPVPTSRGLSDYDPTSLLVDWISQLTTIPRAVGVLARFGLISEYNDVGMPLDTTRGGFNVTAAEAVIGKNILLVDGIFCSGHTVTLASQALRSAGAKSVKVLVFTQIQRNQKPSP